MNQPARLIFAWNPLRLNRILHEAASIQRVAYRRGLVRFALGGGNWFWRQATQLPNQGRAIAAAAELVRAPGLGAAPANRT